MSFDLSWFKTIPGLLITGGVVLLIIALIIFIVTSKNNKKEKKKSKDEVVNSDNSVVTANNEPNPSNTGVVDNTANEQNTAVAVQPTPVLEQPVQAVPSSEVLNNVNEAQSINTSMENSVSAYNVPSIEPVSSVPVVESVPSNMPSSDIIDQPIMNGSMDVSSSNVQADVSPIEQLTDNSVTPINEVSPISTATPEVISVNTPEIAPVVTPEVAPSPEVVSVNTTPVVETTIPAVEPTVDVVPNVETLTSNNTPSPSIYGGVSQIIPDINLNSNNNNSHQIYGGADPLENTQAVPVINPEPVVSNVNTTSQPTVNVIPDTLTPSIPMPTVSVEPVNDNNSSNTVSNSSDIMPMPQETPVVPIGIPAVQVIATAPIMPPENK